MSLYTWLTELRYCARSVAAGSRRMARRIGTSMAMAAQAINTDTAALNAIGSYAVTPKSRSRSDGATDPTLTNADVGAPIPDPAPRPRLIAERRERGGDFPEAVDQEPLDPVIRTATTVDARMKPDYARVRVPVLALYQAQPPFEEVAACYAIRNDHERAVLRQEYAVTGAFYTRYQEDLRAGVPAARIVELTGANLFMFLSNEADVLREIRAFAAALNSR